jgi:hypothetical protein
VEPGDGGGKTSVNKHKNILLARLWASLSPSKIRLLIPKGYSGVTAAQKE